MEIKGIVYKIFDVNDYGKFRKVDVVIKTKEQQYSQTILVQFSQSRMELLQNIRLGDEVEVGINIQGKEWQSPIGDFKYFNTLQGWSLKKIKEPEFDLSENIFL